MRNIVGAFPQRGQPQRHDTEAVVEVVTQLALDEQLLNVAMCRCQKPHVEGDELATSQAPDFLLLEDAEEIHLGLGAISPISSRKRVPRWAISNQPGLRRVAPLKAPFSYPKSSLSIKVSGSAPTFEAMNGPERRGPSCG